jgi:hypothetical protein
VEEYTAAWLARMISERFHHRDTEAQRKQELIPLCLCASVVNLSRMSYMHHVTILHNVVLAFEP